jgi:hypothetical protein
MEHPTPQSEGQEPGSGQHDRPVNDPDQPRGAPVERGGTGMAPGAGGLDEPVPEGADPGRPEDAEVDTVTRPDRP